MSTENLLHELIEQRKKSLLKHGQRLIPHLTSDDLLQPNDFPELENHPEFRYEEGLLHGLLMFEAALKAQTFHN